MCLPKMLPETIITFSAQVKDISVSCVLYRTRVQIFKDFTRKHGGGYKMLLLPPPIIYAPGGNLNNKFQSKQVLQM